MREKKTDEAGRKATASAQGREARLAQALRANLLKRKAQARAKSSAKACEEGGQDPS